MEVERLVTTGTRFTKIENVLSDDLFNRFRKYCKNLKYINMTRENNTTIYVNKIPRELDDHLTKLAEDAIGKQLEIVHSFIRLNTSIHDIGFRVHSDGKVLDKFITIAAIFYLDTSKDSGTGFYKHPEHGDKALNEEYHVFTEDDGKWELYDKFYEKENTMIVYDAKLFHGRFPWKSRGTRAKDGRIVIVKFMRERNE